MFLNPCTKRVIELLTKTVPPITSKTKITSTISKLYIIIPEACGIMVTISILTQVY